MTPLLSVRGLTKSYASATGAPVQALAGVDFDLAPGEALGVVGESGCGKSTLGRALLRLVEPTSGSVTFQGQDILSLSRRQLAQRRRDMQIVFQDPFGALNPRHKVGTIIGEPLAVHDIPNRARRIAELLEMVGLPADAAQRFPHEFSGGQRQRVAIARALALNPKLLIADEPVSALDVSIQSQIINLIADLRGSLGLSMIFISHDLSVVRHVSDRIAVMYFGRIVEIAPAQALFDDPAHPYSQALVSAVPLPDPSRRKARVILEGELPDPANPPPGCAFQSRCPFVTPRCRTERPALVERRIEVGLRSVACHLAQTA
jgi:peptide/nickel transport system ATP-binding protein/oligopeptide transport system ATP-binding protein